VRREYQIASKKDSRRLRQFLAQHGQALQPMVELIEQGRLAVEQLVHDLGRAALEAVLLVSAEQVAGPPHPGRAGGAIRRHGQQGGVVALGARRCGCASPGCAGKAGDRGRKCRSRRMPQCGPLRSLQERGESPVPGSERRGLEVAVRAALRGGGVAGDLH